MSTLTQSDGDEVFDLLVSAYDAAPPDQGNALLARLCLLLAQRVGDVSTIREAVQQASDADGGFPLNKGSQK